MIPVNPILLLIWIVGSWLVAMLGRNKRFGFVGNFLVSFIFSPVVGIIVLLASDDRDRGRAVKR
jgi:hypothetical protein